MGLDMYLKASKYLSPYNERDAKVAYELSKMIPAGVMKFTGVEVEAMYWRKANAIHGWFVNNVQDGVDECQESHVPREALAALKEACDKVLEDPSKAQELLPPTAGFFFGSDQVDEYFLEYVKDTSERLAILLGPEYSGWDFYYRSSW